MPERPKIATNMLELVGHTPMVRLNRFPASHSAELVAKLESYNPMNSVKDRIGRAMIETAEREGRITPQQTVIVEATSGNTGIGLALAATVRGYALVVTMPDNVTAERRRVLAALGAQVVLTPAADGMKGALQRAAEIVEHTPHGWTPAQFENPANPAIHRLTTAEEIWADTDGELDAFVAGVGTGGTITGVGQILKARLGHRVRVVAVEPAPEPGPTRTQGLMNYAAAGYTPSTYDPSVVDQVVAVDYDDAVDTVRQLAREEGIFCGISSGAAAFAGRRLAAELGPGHRVVFVVADFGERYLSHEVFNEAGLTTQRHPMET
jgi:cysteine synthase